MTKTKDEQLKDKLESLYRKAYRIPLSDGTSKNVGVFVDLLDEQGLQVKNLSEEDIAEHNNRFINRLFGVQQRIDPFRNEINDIGNETYDREIRRHTQTEMKKPNKRLHLI